MYLLKGCYFFQACTIWNLQAGKQSILCEVHSQETKCAASSSLIGFLHLVRMQMALKGKQIFLHGQHKT